ncbi:(d)CMP kinase, partial [bacterium]|nr:(d)CMP kinase [bacterium]
AKRRRKEMLGRGIEQSLDEVESAIRTRDDRDSTRAHSPLRKAQDAIELDTTHLTIGDQVEHVVEMARKVMAARRKG